MACNTRDIVNATPSEDKNKTEQTTRKILNTSAEERMEASHDPIALLTRIINAVKPTLNGEKVHLLDLKRTDDGEFVIKYKLGKSTKVYEMEVEDFSSFMVDSNQFRLDKNHLEKIYSNYDAVYNYDDFEELALDITNNPNKIMETAESLIEADEYHNDEEHNIVLRQQLQRITSTLVEMVPNLNVHINNAGKANFGQINVKEGSIHIVKGVGGSKSLMEIYVHELYHAVTDFALSNVNTYVRSTTARIEKLRANFLKHTKESDLVRMSGNTISLQDAEKILDHLTDPKQGLHEFVALSMTNKAVMNQLKSLNINDKEDTSNQPLFYRLLDAVTSLFNAVAAIVTKEPKDNDLARMVFLVAKLNQAHKKPLEAKRLAGIRNLISIFEPLERKWEDFWSKKERDAREDITKSARKKGEGNLRYGVRLAARSFYDQNARDIIGNAAALTNIPFLQAEGTMRTMLREMQQGDKLENLAGRFGMISQHIDQQREFLATYTSKTVMEGMTRKLTEEEESVLTDVILDTDLSSVFFTYDIKALLSSRKNVNKEIANIIKRLEALTDGDKDRVNFYDGQTSLLAAYMVNHVDNIALLKNADNIAKQLGTKHENMEVSSEIVRLIDELATLKAIGRTSTAKKQAMLELMEDQPSGVDNLVAFQFGQKDFAEKTLFKTPADKMKIIKGYSAQIMDQDLETTVAPVDKEKELKAQGYKLVKVLVSHEMDGNKTDMGLYVNNTFMQQRFHRVGLRTTEKARRGTSVSEKYALAGDDMPGLRAAADIRKMKKRMGQVVELMREGKYNAEDEVNSSDLMISPVLNNKGEVRNFTYGMDKQVKIDVLGMERKISVVLGRTAASTYDKKETESFNEKILNLIMEDVEKNLKDKKRIGTNNKEYIKIHKDSDNKEVLDFWKILPTEVKVKYKEGFHVRRDLMYSFLGFRELSVTDMPVLSNMIEAYPTVFGKVVKYALQFAETLWKELIKISKADIIIRTPGVFIGNVVSNFMLMYVSGYSFKEITRLKLQGVKELNLYVEGLKRRIALEAKENAGIISKAEKRELNTIQNNLDNSPVKDLVDEGFYTTIIEEMEHGEETGSYFTRKAKKKLNSMPKIFSDGVNALYITESTKLFKLIEKGVQASDFAARYAQFHLMREKGISKEKAIVEIRDNFIDYNKPNSRFLEWANQMGFVMFTKYFTRIQRVIFKYGKRDPLKVLLSILAQDYALGEIDTFDDQSLITKDMGNLFYNPLDNLMRVITPSGVEVVDWAVNGGR
jgi:hypothetical protein